MSELLRATIALQEDTIERLTYRLGKCEEGSVIRTRINDKQVAEIERLTAECELNRNCKLAVVIAKERISELEARVAALEGGIAKAQARVDALEAGLETYADEQYWNKDLTHAKGMGPGIAKRALAAKEQEGEI